MNRDVFVLLLLPVLFASFPAAAVGAQEKAAKGAQERDAPRPLRLAVLGKAGPPERLCTHLYGGGFETKTLLFETLVKRDAEGRIVPGLASAWEFRDGGKTVILTLRKGAVFHDGRAVDAEVVRWNFRCWVGQPAHAWLGASRRIRRVTALGSDRVRIEMDRPYALLPDLCAVSPAGILGPGSVNRRGRYAKPVGSGPFRFLASREQGRVLRYARFRPGETGVQARDVLELVRFPEDGGDQAVDALLKGTVDLLADTWITRVPRSRIAELKANPDVRLGESPGSSVMVLHFNLKRGPTADRRLRRKIRKLIDRDDLIGAAERGHADPCFAWSAPTVKVWPRSRLGAGDVREGPRPEGPRPEEPLRLVVKADDRPSRALAPVLAAQLRRAGLEVKVVVLKDQADSGVLGRGDYDLRLLRTWGVPYDPYISLVDRFLPAAGPPPAGAPGSTGVLADLARLVEEATRHPDLEGRRKVYREIQDLMDREAVLVPLYVPRRVAVVRAGLPLPRLGHDIYRLDLTPVLAGR